MFQLAFAGPGVINDPDGFTNVRAEPSENAAIVGRVKTGETFEYEGRGNTPWWKVTLASGKKGWMHSSRIRRFAVLEDIVVAENDEVNIWARREGLSYYTLARAAAKGDPAAMQRYFGLGCDGAACETHDEVFVIVIHLLGDEKLARFLSQQTPSYQKEVGDLIKNSNALLPFEQVGYMKRNFPKTAKVLFPR
jgi:Bacterial SH3 domain